MDIGKLQDAGLIMVATRQRLFVTGMRGLAWLCWLISLAYSIAGWTLAAMNHLSWQHLFAE